MRRFSIFVLLLLFLAPSVHAEDIAIGTDNLAAIKGARRVAIDQFGVEFITTLKATGSGGGSSASVQADLLGVSDAAMQAFTDRAYQDTVAALTAAGFEIVPMETLLARPDYLALADKIGRPSPYVIDDSGTVSKIVAPTGMKAFFQTASSNRASMGERFTALNGANGAQASAIAKDMDVHFVRFHFLASFGTSKASGGFLANMSKKARASIEAGPTLVAKETQAQIISQEGQRVFLMTSRTGVNGAVYLDRPLKGPADGYALEETTSADRKTSDGMANAVSTGLALLVGGSASSTKNSTAAVTISEATFNETYGTMVATARDALVDKLKSGAK